MGLRNSSGSGRSIGVGKRRAERKLDMSSREILIVDLPAPRRREEHLERSYYSPIDRFFKECSHIECSATVSSGSTG
jgi:hypothetical protein